MSLVARSLASACMLVALCSGSALAQTWQNLLNQADSLSRAQNVDSAVVVCGKALELVEQQVGNDDTTTARVLNHLGLYCTKAGYYVDAITHLKRALAILEKSLGARHIAVADTRIDLGKAYLNVSDYTEAEEMYGTALSIYEEKGMAKTDQAADCCMWLGYINRDLGFFGQARDFYSRSLEIYEALHGRDHVSVARVLNSMATLFREWGNYARAEKLYREAIVIRERHLDPCNIVLASSYDDFGANCREQGTYGEAEYYIKKGLRIFEKKYRHDHPALSSPLCNLANLYTDVGKFTDAESLLTRALAIDVKASIGTDSLDLALTFDIEAGLYYEMGRYKRAEELCRQSLAIRERAFPPTHYLLAVSLSNLANIVYQQGNYADAESLYVRALEIYKGALPEENQDVAAALYNLATIYREEEDVARAEPLYLHALEIWESVIGPDHRDVAMALEQLSVCYRMDGDNAKALDIGERAFKIRWNDLQETGRVLSERDAVRYSLLLRASASNALSCCFALQADPRIEATALTRRIGDMILASKGNVSDIIFDRRRALVAEKDSTILQLVESLNDYKSECSSLYATSPVDISIATYRRQLDSLCNIANELESELSHRSVSYRDRQALENVTCERIETQIPQNAALIEFLKYNRAEVKPRTATPRYVALVLDGSGSAAVVDLGNASHIDSLVSRYLQHMNRMASQSSAPLRDDRLEYGGIARRLYDRVMYPLGPHVAGKDFLLIAPDGELNHVSFAGLTDRNGKYLVEGVPVHYLSAGRDLVRLEKAEAPGSGLLALGDPAFDAIAVGRPEHAGSSERITAANPDKASGLHVRLGDIHAMKVRPLVGSRREIERVVDAWKTQRDEPVITFLGAEATEDNLVAQAPGRRVLHISTHGYLAEGSRDTLDNGGDIFASAEAVRENPLLLSGLFLAGANRRSELPDTLDVDDGILTAYEVSALNLSGAGMVVLSACESGLGAIRSGEGVYGLRRAFEMAGARTVVSSLWPVPDRATGEMLSLLYGHSEEPLPERIRSMQLDQLKKLRKRGLADHPYMWAGFIAIGNWR